MFNLKSLFGNKEENGVPQPAQSSGIAKLFDKNEKEVARIRPTVERIASLGPELKALSDDELKLRSQALKDRFKDEVTKRVARGKDPQTGEAYDWRELDAEMSWSDDYNRLRRDSEKAVLDELLPEAFALVREASDRTIGLRHFDVQMIGGAVLHSGRIGEMRTGEGKTLVATSPAYLNALSGRGVHVITVNDYLAERDANWMRPIYEFLGLTVAFLTNDMETEQRQQAYGADILYATNSEVGFDYLRDNMARSPQEMVQRALNFAIVDEVDNILIDEARTPLIISAQVAKTDRALRRQQMAKTCDSVARRLMPAVTDREVDSLLDSLTTKGRLDTTTLLDEMLRKGAFTQATRYLIDAYLLSEQSARTENAARLLDAADELAEVGLIDEAGRAELEAQALNAVRPRAVRAAWEKETARLTEPFARAWAGGIAAREADASVVSTLLSDALSLPEDAQAEMPSRFEEVEAREAIAAVVAIEMARRGLVEDAEDIAQALLQLPLPEAGAEGDGRERVARETFAQTHPALREAALSVHGHLQEANALLNESLTDVEIASPDEARNIEAALESISTRGLLPFDAQERLWETVRLGQGRVALRRNLEETMQKHGGSASKQIAALVADYSRERDEFLKREAEALRDKLGGHEAVAAKAKNGEDVGTLRKALIAELMKSGAFAGALKAAKNFAGEQSREHGRVAETLAGEMEVYVEVPRDLKRTLASILSEGGKEEAVRERLTLAVRDLPGENAELPALCMESAHALQAWREEHAQNLLDEIAGLGLQLPDAEREALRSAIEDGEQSSGFESFVGEQLLSAPEAANLAQAVESWGAKWDEFRQASNSKLLSGIEGTLKLSSDAGEALEELLESPSQGALDKAIFGELASDAVSRHLEPLLNEENAGAFTEEVKRRVPLAKETQNKLKPDEFIGRSAEQLERAVTRVLERSFAATQFDDFKRVIRNLGWLVEKDEKRRQAALTDMGTLIAEREAGSPAFTDPDNFLDTLQAAEILTDEEAAIIRRAQAEEPNTSLSKLIDRDLRLPAERRRRLSEAKLQEVQPILDQSIKAHALFAREVNYVIDAGREIVIVDEFTGRKMPGRRYSEGLHEALEAKHGLEVQLESQTVATITIQNYFRLYNKLGGMTGTAKTEEQEFAKTYGIEVVSIPTNRAISRRDAPDVVYKTAEAKMRAVTFEILEHFCAGQPVLVGTRSVEVSERMSERLKSGALQTLILTHLIKERLRTDKNIPNEQKAQMFALCNAPIVPPTAEEAHHLKSEGRIPSPVSPMQIKNIAKTIGMQGDATTPENVDALFGYFTVAGVDKSKFVTALRVGLPHNVLNAKNHRNEARIIAEAARPGAVTIATNMAGRGVDIVLGGTLDVESKWRVMTLQILSRQLGGETMHVRARNQEATDKLLDRLTPERLQSLAWVSLQIQKVEELEKSGALEGQAAKEIRDALGQELSTPDVDTKIRSRARRLGLADKLAMDAEPLDDAVVGAVSREIERLTQNRFDARAIHRALEEGVNAQSTGRDMVELVLMHALALPLQLSQQLSASLLETLCETPDLDRLLLQAAQDESDAAKLAEAVGDVTPEWVTARLKALSGKDAASLPEAEIEINEPVLLRALGENNLGVQWLRERLNEWKLIKDARAFEATPELGEFVGDSAVVHYRLNREAAREVLAKWQSEGDYRRERIVAEVPNVITLNDMAQMVGQAPEPQWLHGALEHFGLIGEGDAARAQMVGEARDEAGNVQQVPVDVIVYRYRLPRLLAMLDPTLREAVVTSGSDAAKVMTHLEASTPWALEFVDEAWVQERLKSLDAQPAQTGPAQVLIETGVAGQSADIVLESEPRPEDIAHTSEQEEVKTLGGLHIIGTERHESRRIDNQLRGRAGRQGDPGSSRFYVSLEDELWRLFGVRGQFLLNQWDEDEAVEAKIISKSIERAQKKVELNHFEGRKHVLQYDDVMNVQREVIYRERRRALMGGDLRDTVLDMTQQAAVSEAEKHCPREVRPEEWDTHRLYLGLSRLIGAQSLGKQLKADDLSDLSWAALPDSTLGQNRYDAHLHDGRTLYGVVEQVYAEREEAVGEGSMRDLERWLVTRAIDEHWMEHLAEMDYLRDAIWQEGYAQKEPIGVYRQEGFALFQKMLGEIRREVTEGVFSTQMMASEQAAMHGPELFGLEEARLLEPLSMDDDGFDDGVMLDKDADGDEADEPALVAASASHSLPPAAPRNSGGSRLIAGPSAGPSSPQGDSGQKMSRQERRRMEREQKKR